MLCDRVVRQFVQMLCRKVLHRLRLVNGLGHWDSRCALPDNILAPYQNDFELLARSKSK